MSNHVEYVVEKKGLGPTAYFIAAKEEGGEWVAGFFPAYMAPDPGDDDDMIFDLANPDHTSTGASKEEAENNMRDWIEKNYKVIERRSERTPR